MLMSSLGIFLCQKPPRTGTELSGYYKDYIMPADALAPCVARSSAAMMETTWNKQVIVFHKEGFQ